ncbi:tetratricopeptide repeat protein [Crocosphaera sp. XPORK-15E]|uniref:tetratricopeptide repeat protein n=1 Tax=Crocosphaera sp. XPORK-15E TaxID=3110247 RepID=UPI002B2142AD|nr:tetratricopeptide repeat protein [Crocosphaera sp. XPORK-15E]MEA5536757.1 tetratricopeptide repeat protein [Crocosphaera sp. XPORK-15E]
MKSSQIDRLLQDLKEADELARQRATNKLWQIWFEQKGELGLELLRRSQFFLEAGNQQKAEEILTETIQNYPDFAEAWNRRAVLYFTQEQYEKSKQDCQKVVQLIPYHFGAWHGLGLCLLALGEYTEAIAAFRKALEVQPHALINQKLILECTALL